MSGKREQKELASSAERKTNVGRNVPNLRFPEFEGEWETQSLGEVGEPFIGLTYSPSDVVSEGGVIVFRSSNIQNGEIDYSDIVRVNKKLKDSIVTRKDDLLICARNGSPRLIGKNALLKESDANQTFGAFMLVYRSPDNHFIHQLLSTKRYYSQVSENLGARINQITTANIKDFEFFFPKDKDERDKISRFLDLIDQRIAIQNRVIEDLKKLKTALCREALKTLENLPKSRLGKHCTIVTGKLDANAMSDGGKYMFFTCARENYRTDTYAFDGDALLISGNGELGLCKFYSGKFNAYQRTYVLQHFDIDIQFAKLMIDAYLPKKIHKEKNVGAMPYIVLSTLSDLQIPIPNASVQKHISSVIRTIDEMISLEDSMLVKSNTVKHYLLSKMFM